MPRLLSVALATAIATVLLAAPRRADAYERQWHAGIGLGYAVVSSAGAKSGLGGGLHLTYGLSDTFNLLVEADFTAHPAAKGVLVPSASAGLAYVFDVLQWVPYVGAMAGAYDLWRTDETCGVPDANGVAAPCHQGRIGASIPFGLDYQLNRSFAVGFAGRYHVLFLGRYPGSYLTTFLRAELIWGY